MPGVVIIYDSVTKNTAQMAEILAAELKKLDTPCDLFHIDDFEVKKLLDYDGIIVGTPNYFGSMSSKLKKLFDDSVRYYRKLDGKLGAAFCSTGIIGGGGETAIIDVITAMMIHGMIVMGSPHSGHYGVLSIGSPDERVKKELSEWASRFVKVLNKLFA